MKRRVLFSAAMALLLSGCAGGSPPAAPAPAAPPPESETEVFDPAGTYDFTVAAQGMELVGVMVIEGSSDAGYTGTMETEMGGGPMDNIVLEGLTMTFSLTQFGMDGQLEFEGDEFSGFMSGGMGEADIYGVKR